MKERSSLIRGLHSRSSPPSRGLSRLPRRRAHLLGHEGGQHLGVVGDEEIIQPHLPLEILQQMEDLAWMETSRADVGSSRTRTSSSPTATRVSRILSHRSLGDPIRSETSPRLLWRAFSTPPIRYPRSLPMYTPVRRWQPHGGGDRGGENRHFRGPIVYCSSEPGVWYPRPIWTSGSL